ncbi:MAG: hypothetical protein KIT36_08765 [Alphaproteobacteria bacterium]|nr:hypothetical protein [Alphaproteobacteria bacterium]
MTTDAFPRHSWRHRLAGGETTVALTDIGLTISEPDAAPRLVAYADVERVNLRFRPQRSAPDSYVCRIESRGAPPFDIRSTSWRNPLWLQDQSATYLPLVLGLHAQLAQRLPPPLFVAGDPPWYFRLQIALWILPIPIIFLVLHDTDWPTRLMYSLLPIFPFGFVALIYWYRRLRPNRPRSYDPRAIPPELLPRPRRPA